MLASEDVSIRYSFPLICEPCAFGCLILYERLNDDDSELHRKSQTQKPYYGEHHDHCLSRDVMTRIDETCHSTIVATDRDAYKEPKISV